MTVAQYKKTNLALFAILLGIIVFSLWKGFIFLTFLGIGFYMAIVSLLKTRVRGILADERQTLVGAKAAETSFRVIVPLLMFTSLALLSANKEGFHYLQSLGLILAYVTCLAIVIYQITYWYFDRQTGGTQK